MGEITNLILSGVLDCETGEYIGAACGYPRLGPLRILKMVQRNVYLSH